MANYICYDCANFPNGRLTMRQLPNGDYVELVDGKVVKSYFNPPSRKVRCSECGERVRSFMEVQ